MAVKVRHPGVSNQISLDLTLVHDSLKVLSSLFPQSLGWMELPVTVDELRRVLLSQCDLNFEFENLKRFRIFFSEYDQIDFPEPIFSTESVLVESFEDAWPV